jgi:hypothetical protein
MKLRIALALSFFILFGSHSLFARHLAVTAGVGNWYSDDLQTSYQYGGGILIRPGLEWLEFSLSYDRAPISVKAGERLAPNLKDQSLSFWRSGVTFPSKIEAMGLGAYFFPLLAYVITQNDTKISHGFGIGGGLEFLLLNEILGARFEALEQFYPLPMPNQNSRFQEDFFFKLHLTASFF